MNKLDEKILNTPVQLGHDTYTFRDLVGINPDDMNYEYQTHASRLAYLNLMLANAEASYQEQKTATERVYARVELDWRETLKTQKTTEPQIKALVIETEEYRKQQLAEQAALREYKLLKGLVEALRERGSMLISLGANLRQEYDVTDMSIRQTKDRLRELSGG